MDPYTGLIFFFFFFLPMLYLKAMLKHLCLLQCHYWWWRRKNVAQLLSALLCLLHKEKHLFSAKSVVTWSPLILQFLLDEHGYSGCAFPGLQYFLLFPLCSLVALTTNSPGFSKNPCFAWTAAATLSDQKRGLPPLDREWEFTSRVLKRGI